MQTLTYRDIYCPFEDAISPFAEKLENEIKSWINQDYGYLPEKIRRKYEHTGVGYVGARLFPKTSYSGLISICRFSLWAFINDDAYERCNTEQLEILRLQVIAALRGQAVESDTITNLQLPVLRKELLKLGGASWMNRFINSLDSYFKGMQLEIPYRSQLKFPKLEKYKLIREIAACVYPLVDLIELETGTVLPDEVALHPIIRRFAQLTCRIMAWANDFYSAPLEDGHDVLNLVLIIRNEENCTMEEAYTKAIAIHNTDIQEFIVLRTVLPDFGEWNSTVNKFLENITLMITGHLQWLELNTARYKRGGHPGSDFQN
ncbi:MAG: hypothetical protein JO154_02760 [Chitinophaga sp.]|uniref:terpene synthase family protein n=1 Tax=Chitinophaga sp. TaxID=1869181 RepID=UPI0025C3D0EC|nr:hypothetical protein [Chitinophaga sp.]MBV8251502.1 hypothetical protein [Chitinophaga sp.]